jgi:hypothetical protein
MHATVSAPQDHFAGKMQEISNTIDTGSYAELLDTIRALNPKQRKAAASWITADWKQRAASSSFAHPRDATEPFARWMRLLVALTATAADPKKALAIPVRHLYAEYGIPWRAGESIPAPASAEAIAALAQSAIARGPEWCAHYMQLVADTKKSRPMFVDVLLLMAHAHALALPTTPVMSELWAVRFSHMLPSDRQVADPSLYAHTAPALELEHIDGNWSVRGRDVIVHSAHEAVRLGQATGPMLLSLFDHRDAVGTMVRNGGQLAMDQAAEVVAKLVADGVVDASQLARQAIAALSRGDSVSCQRLQTRLLMTAHGATEVVVEQARVLANLMGSGTGAAASAAQELLSRADAAAALPDDLFVTGCQMVFARKEKGLRQEQLAWARQRAARAASATSAVLGMTEALLCADHALQKDAAAAVEAAWPALPAHAHAAILAQIEASGGVLDDKLYRSLWERCTGAAPASASAAEGARQPAASSAPERVGLVKQRFEPLADPSRMPAEVKFSLNAYRLARDAYQFERAIQAGVDAINGGQTAWGRAIAEQLGGDMSFWLGIRFDTFKGRDVSVIACLRLKELKEALERGKPFTFISTPSYAHGAIAPARLVERLAALAVAGQTAMPYDLLTALLRTEPCEPEALAALRAIGSTQAIIATEFLAAGGAMQLQTRWLVVGGPGAPHAQRHCEFAEWLSPERREVCVAMPPMPHPPAIDGVRLEWTWGFEPETAPVASEFDMAPNWITPVLPNNAEALAALHLWGFRRAGLEYGTDGGKVVAERLPLFLAAHGPAGPALHLAILYAMTANDASPRLAGSDALVTLLQQGRCDGALACQLLTACIDCGSVKPGRLAASLAQVHEAGETAAVWELVRAGAIAALGMARAPAATADLLELGARVAKALGVKERIAQLAAFAEGIKGKPNKLEAQALRLHACLTD